MLQLNELVDHVRNEFDMNLPDFIRQKAEVEGLYDYEIAQILRVRSSLVGKLRRIYGIKRADNSLGRFRRRFEQTHGKGSIATFKKMIEHPFCTLVDVARYFGFSKENARIVFKRIYGVPYTKLLQEKKDAKRRRTKRLRQKQLWQARLESKRLSPMIWAMAKARSFGLFASIQPDGRSYILCINGHKVLVRYASKASQRGGKKYFRVARRYKNGDFLICICKESVEESYYIIPYGAIVGKEIYIPVPNKQDASDGERYSEFREAWHLLAHDEHTLPNRSNPNKKGLSTRNSTACKSHNRIPVASVC